MAKQTSIITLNGTVGGLSFYKTKDGHIAREKGGVSKDRIMNDPKYARTRENLKEFTENIRTVKLVQDTIRPAIIRIADPKLYQRMVRQMMKVLRTDPVNGRGQRVVAEGDWNLLQGFELNANAILSGTLRTEFSVTDSPAEWSCSVPAFLPADYLVIPQGASHFRSMAAGASFDLTTGNRNFILESGTELPVGQLTGPITLTIPKAGLPDPNKVFIFGIEFLQIVNGQQYAMNNGAHNAAAFLTVKKV
jgi:hypothetical protein